jgi:hypothetical protein
MFDIAARQAVMIAYTGNSRPVTRTIYGAADIPALRRAGRRRLCCVRVCQGDEEALLSAEELRKIDALPVGPARLCQSLLRLLVPHFPKSCQVQSRFLNWGHVRLIKAAGAPSIAAWAAEVVADADREAGLLLIGEESMCLYLLLDATQAGPVACRFNLSPGPAAEVHIYLATLPAGQPWLIAHAKGGRTKSCAPYSGAAGRDAFNSRVNRMLQKTFGEAVTQTTFRLSILRAHAISQGPQLQAYGEPVPAEA